MFAINVAIVEIPNTTVVEGSRQLFIKLVNEILNGKIISNGEKAAAKKWFPKKITDAVSEETAIIKAIGRGNDPVVFDAIDAIMK